VTHLHLPDGALPLWLWLPGFALSAAVIALVNARHRASAADRLALLGSLGALQLATMALPLGPLGYHLTLAPVLGILLGPGLAFVAAVVSNSVLALLGHGGVTTIGLNALVLGATTAVAWLVYRGIGGRASPAWAGGIAALAAQLVSLALFLAIIGVSGLHAGPGAGASGAGLRTHDAHGAHGALDAHDAPGRPAAEGGEGERDVRGYLVRFALLSLPFWIPGMVAEALVTGGVLRFLERVSPSLLPGRPRWAEGRAA
jgi:cobalt/nickel transport system permease protein